MTDEPTKAELIDRIESLEEQQAKFAAEQEQVLGLIEQFKQGQISRRSFLTAVAAVGGVGLVAGRSRAAPSWGSSTGKTGTSSTPLSEGYIQTLKSQSFTTEKIDTSSGYGWSDIGSNRSFDTWEQAPPDKDIYFTLWISATSNDTTVYVIIDINSSQSANSIFESRDTISSTARYGIPSFRVPAGHYYQVRAFQDTADYSISTWSELS
jgi:hypothetical protein